MEVYDLIYTAFADAGIDVYAPDTHDGRCTSDYVVVKQVRSTRFLTYSSTTTYYDILCYSPIYTGALQLATKAEGIMMTIEPSVMPTYNRTEPFYDPDIEAYMISIEYQSHSKNQ